MNRAAQLIESEALALPSEERAQLASRLLASVEGAVLQSPQASEQAWLAEAGRRYEAYLHGNEAALSADEVFAELRAEDV